MRMKSNSLTLEPVSRFMPREGAAVADGTGTYRPVQQVANERSAPIRGTIVAAAHASLRLARLLKARLQQWREARGTYESLRHLDDRALRDLGFDRLEISSVAAEVSGQAERTRSHLLNTF